MSDLDGTTEIKPKALAPTKINTVTSSKKEAQNYFKSLSSSIKKPSAVTTMKEPIVTVKPEHMVRIT